MNFNSNKKHVLVQHAPHQTNDSVRDVDLIPMINVVFLLLTFFMVAGVFRSVNPVAVTLPETAITIPVVNSTPKEITVDVAGAISVDGISYSVDELGNVIASSDGSNDWVVRADAQTPANRVIQVLTAAKAAGLEGVGLQAVSTP